MKLHVVDNVAVSWQGALRQVAWPPRLRKEVLVWTVARKDCISHALKAADQHLKTSRVRVDSELALAIRSEAQDVIDLGHSHILDKAA